MSLPVRVSRFRRRARRSVISGGPPPVQVMAHALLLAAGKPAGVARTESAEAHFFQLPQRRFRAPVRAGYGHRAMQAAQTLPIAVTRDSDRNPGRAKPNARFRNLWPASAYPDRPPPGRPSDTQPAEASAEANPKISISVIFRAGLPRPMMATKSPAGAIAGQVDAA